MKLYFQRRSIRERPAPSPKYLGSPVDFVQRVGLTKGEHKQPGYLAINPQRQSSRLHRR